MDRPSARRYNGTFMAHRGSSRRNFLWHRFARCSVVRALITIVVVPILVLGAFGGITFFAHAHGEHDPHLHAAPFASSDRFCPEQHQLAHASGAATCDEHPRDNNQGEPGNHTHLSDCSDHPVSLDDSQGLLITIPDHEQLASRGVELSQIIQASPVFQAPSAWLAHPPDLAALLGDPGDPSGPGGGAWSPAPVHLASLKAVHRLVRTSGSLLL